MNQQAITNHPEFSNKQQSSPLPNLSSRLANHQNPHLQRHRRKLETKWNLLRLRPQPIPLFRLPLHLFLLSQRPRPRNSHALRLCLPRPKLLHRALPITAQRHREPPFPTHPFRFLIPLNPARLHILIKRRPRTPLRFRCRSRCRCRCMTTKPPQRQAPRKSLAFRHLPQLLIRQRLIDLIKQPN
jgi:hypothetical protein